MSTAEKIIEGEARELTSKEPVQKPFSMQLEAFRKDLARIINESNFHPEISLMVIDQIRSELIGAVNVTKENEEKNYYDSIDKQ